MAETILYAQGVEIGKSLCQPDAVPVVKEIMARAKRMAARSCCRIDVVVAKRTQGRSECQVCDVGDIPQDLMILDMGPRSVADLKRRFAEMKTLALERPARRLRNRAFRQRHLRADARGGRACVSDGKLVAIAGGGDTVCGSQYRRRWRRISPMCPRPAAPSSNGWRARPFRPLPRWQRATTLKGSALYSLVKR